jgi:methylated-DNA-[protein]-cysteine S-methyltransferase
MYYIYFYETKIGRVEIAENGIGIIKFCFSKDIPKDANIIETPLLKKANEQLQEYLVGKRKEFDLPLIMEGTEFQIFLPCHRVIGANGDLVGYAGGLDVKRKLLEMEKENDKG